MEIHNGNYEEILIRQGKILKKDDKIIFRVNDKNLTYTVFRNHCHCCDDSNDQIFTELGIDSYATCRKSYGYESRPCCVWPPCKDDDYKALTRVVIDLFKLINPQKSSKTIGVSIPRNQIIKIIL